HGEWILVSVSEPGLSGRRAGNALFAPCAMPRLMRLIANVWDSTETYRPARILPPRQRDLHHEHRAILTAFQRGDAAAVVAESDRHREHLLDVVLEVRLVTPDADAQHRADPLPDGEPGDDRRVGTELGSVARALTI